jgi:hypothetical protein
MPALVASRCDFHAKAFFENALARKKARLRALIAVARKLPHALYGLFRSGLKYEWDKAISKDHVVLTRFPGEAHLSATDPNLIEFAVTNPVGERVGLLSTVEIPASATLLNTGRYAAAAAAWFMCIRIVRSFQSWTPRILAHTPEKNSRKCLE